MRDVTLTVHGTRRGKIVVALIAIAFALFVGVLVRACFVGGSVGRRFVAAVRERRVDDARALAAPYLASRLDILTSNVSPNDLADGQQRALVMLRDAPQADVSVGIGEIGRVCLQAQLPGDVELWIRVESTDEGGWRVIATGETEPDECRSD